MRAIVPLAAFLLVAAVAQAQNTAQNTAPVTPAPQGATRQELNTAPGAGAPAAGNVPEQAPASGTTPHRHRKSLQQRFEAANTTHDGHLTAEQAQAHWPSVARHFAEIDKNHRGYVTLDEIHAYRAAHRHHKATAAATPK